MYGVEDWAVFFSFFDIDFSSLLLAEEWRSWEVSIMMEK